MKFDYEKSLTRSDALEGILAQWSFSPKTTIVPLEEAYQRVLAEDVYALHSLPVVRSSRCDGIAVRSADFAQGMPATNTWKQGRDYAKADTGDDFPDCFDAIIAIEEVIFCENGGLTVTKNPEEILPGSCINPCGAIVEQGSLVAKSNTLLSPELVAALAVSGFSQVPVIERLKLAFIPTGSELISFGKRPERGQNIDANSLLVKGLVEQWGAELISYPIVPDDRLKLEEVLEEALKSVDVVLINGGSSRGEEDFNSYLIEEKASYFRHGVRAIPGRPIGMAILEGKPVINIPGPVLAAFLAMDWLVRGLVAHYYGIPLSQRQVIEAQLEEDIVKPKLFEKLTRVRIRPNESRDGFLCKTIGLSAGVPQILEKSDGIFSLPIGSSGAMAGDIVSVELFRPLNVIERSWQQGVIH